MLELPRNLDHLDCRGIHKMRNKDIYMPMDLIACQKL